MTTLRSSKLAALAVTLVASACANASDVPLAEPNGRMRAAPVSVVQAPDGTRHVTLVVAPAEPSGPLELMQVALDGKLVPDESIRSHRASSALVVLVDDSAAMGERGLSPAANGLLQAVAHAVAPHSDRIGAMSFNDAVNERYHYASPQSLVKRRGLRLDPAGNRCLNLGLESALAAATNAPLPSRSVLVATSGDDSGGSCPAADRDALTEQAQAQGIAVNVAHLGPSEDGAKGLKELASKTGGQFWEVGPTDSLDAVAGAVASALASQLYVSFRIPGGRGEIPLEVRAGADDSVLAATLDLHAENGVITTHNDELALPVAAAAIAGAVGAGSVSADPAAPDGSSPASGPETGPPAAVAPVPDGGAAPAAVARTAAAASAASSGLTTSMAIAGGMVAVGLLLMRKRRARKERETHVALAAVRANAEAERRAQEAARSAEAARALEVARAEELEQAAAAARLDEAARAAEVARAAEEQRMLDQARALEEAEAAQIARAREEAREEQIRKAEDERAAEVARAHDEERTREAERAAEEERERLAAEEAIAAERAAAAAAALAVARPPDASDRKAVNGATPYAHAAPPIRAAARSDAAPFALVGTVCGRYRLEAPLGRGGLGEVYRARDLQFDRTVAVKVLSDDVFGGADAFDSLMREVSLVDRITHPNVVRVYDVIRFEGRVAIVMEYVHGQSLSAITREQGVIAPEDFDPVLSGVAEALDAAHAAGVVHGDVTPGNVLITEDGKVKLCDFGVGRLVGDDPSAPRAGTPRFVAPEVINGADAGPHSDVFSLGALTLHVIAGRDADLTAVSAPFRRALEGALEPDPFMRCASAGALAVAFHHAVDEDFMRRRGPVRRFVDTLRLRTRREPDTGPVDLPPTVTFPALASSRSSAHDYVDPDQTRPLPPPGEFTAPFTPDVTQPLGPR